MKKRGAMLMTALVTAATLSYGQKIKEVGGFQNPESVIAHKKHLLVSNMGAQLDPKAKDGDGFISMVNRKDGKMIEEKFITGLNSPKGMLVHGNKLIIADVDKVVMYNIKTKKKLKEADFSSMGVNYLNDIAPKGCGSIFVSATDKNAIYKVCHSGKIKQLKVKGDLEGANGLKKGCGKLFVANYGRGTQPDGNFGRICLANKKFKVYNSNGIFDGVVKVGGKLVLSDWGSTDESKGRLVVYSVCKKKLKEVNLGRTINGPADIFADCKTKQLWIPAMRENKILAVSYADIKK